MKRKRKYFDDRGNETTAGRGVTCQEIVVDDDNRVVSETFYENRERPSFTKFDEQALKGRLKMEPELAQ